MNPLSYVQTVVPSPEEVHDTHPDLLAALRRVRGDLPASGLVFLTNTRKKLLAKIYERVIDILGSGKNKTVLEVNQLKPGCLTNVQHKDFFQASHIVMILTKNHNHRELKILEQIDKIKVPVTLIKIDTSKRSKYPSFRLEGVRAIYNFMYNLESLDLPVDQTPNKDLFLKKYSFI